MEKFISAPKALQLFEALILDTPKKKLVTFQQDGKKNIHKTCWVHLAYFPMRNRRQLHQSHLLAGIMGLQSIPIP